MILATTKVEDFDRFLSVFSTKGAEKRKQHGSKGSTVFRDPNEDDRVWVLFDWDGEGWQNFVSDPDVPAILQEAGHKGKPQAAELGGQYDAWVDVRPTRRGAAGAVHKAGNSRGPRRTWIKRHRHAKPPRASVQPCAQLSCTAPVTFASRTCPTRG